MYVAAEKTLRMNVCTHVADYNNIIIYGILYNDVMMHGKRRVDGAQFRSDSQHSYTSNWPWPGVY